MALVISDKSMRSMQMTEAELRLEIAILLYKSKRYSIGKSAEFAGIPKIEMHRVLAEREIPLNITVEDVVQDMENIKSRMAG